MGASDSNRSPELKASIRTEPQYGD
nr:hypothetical protein [Salmonella enterica subsp. enterica serovar Infantis]